MKALALIPLILAAAVAMARAEESQPDLIDGYRTQDFLNMLPGKVADMQLMDANADVEKHSLRAQYRTADKSSSADVLIYMPPGSEAAPIEDEAGAIKQAIAEVEKAMTTRGFKGSRHELTSPGGEPLLCISGEQEAGKIYYVYCAAVAKGRLMALQTLSQMAGTDRDAILSHSDAFTGELVDIITTAP